MDERTEESIKTLEIIEVYDPIKHAVPPNNLDDMFVLAPDSVQSSWHMFVQRIRRLDFIIVYSVIIVMSALYIISSTIGLYTTWYKSLKKLEINPWLISS